MSDAQQAAFLIDGVAYPIPTTFRLADPVLVEEVTGLKWDEFHARNQAMVDLRDDPDAPRDPLVMLGLIAVAVWQKNPLWKRDRAARFVEQVNIESLDAFEPAPVEVDATQIPPAVGGAHESPNGSANSSDGDTGPVTTQHVPGHPLSVASTD